jgi:hypothetical protein
MGEFVYRNINWPTAQSKQRFEGSKYERRTRQQLFIHSHNTLLHFQVSQGIKLAAQKRSMNVHELTQEVMKKNRTQDLVVTYALCSDANI